MHITDHIQRQTALDPTRSFIVQAPAGSGKTELLTQRFLNLLATAVQTPEEIIAITFTRKAAAEMRARILQTLATGTSAVAIAARERDQQMGWQLTNNSNRLRIMTIDALCNYLVRQMPLKANCGNLTISENPKQLYALAVQNLILQHAEDSFCTDALQQVLWHVDSNVSRFTELCIDMLSHRDQWLPHIYGLDAIQELEKGLAHVVTELLEKCAAALPKISHDEIFALINFAAQHSPNTKLKKWCDLTQFPIAQIKYIDEWLALAQLLLNKDGNWRKKFTIQEGFPSASSAKNKEDKELYKDYKQRLESCLQILQQHEECQENLANLLVMPALYYNQEQTDVIKSLTKLLPVLVAELQLIFKQENQVDFTEITLRALQALGESDDPTDLSLSLDYSIHHLLIDEFQDTSLTQWRLIEKLIAGWSPQEGRTLFLVGDPMQSIYRFRKAEVGLFLQVQQSGIANMNPESLTLATNFRATKNLVDWFNKAFIKIFPQQADPALGAIAYVNAQALATTATQQAVHYQQFANVETTESQQVINIIKRTWLENPRAKIAILVRARQHLIDIINALHAADIPYRSVDIASLQDHPAVQDLFSLTRALLHPADRIAWLAILRAPWCGLSLNDLHVIVGYDHDITIWDALLQTAIDKLSDEGQKRYHHFMQALQPAMLQRGRLALGEWIENTWKALQGPACLKQSQDLLSVNAYLKLLYSLPFDVDITVLQTRLAQLTMPANLDPNIQLELMTIHKSKGLEFDVIILPGLNKITRPDMAKLFLWTERVNRYGKPDLLMAPIKEYSEKSDSIYSYLKSEEDKKSQFELQRLLYVAATRAKQALHLLIPTDITTPEKNTLLVHLWPVIVDDISLSPRESTDVVSAATPFLAPPLQRLKLSALTIMHNIDKQASLEISDNTTLLQTLAPSAIDKIMTLLPTIFHKLIINHIAAPKSLSEDKFQSWLKIFLLQNKFSNESLTQQCQFITEQLTTMLNDPQGQWLLQLHQEYHFQYQLNGIIDNKLVNITIDAMFIDEQNRRWLIMYGNGDASQQKKYQRLLEQFATLFSQQEQREIYLGVYFPLTNLWVEWQWDKILRCAALHAE